MNPLILAIDPGVHGALVFGHTTQSIFLRPFNGTPVGLDPVTWSMVQQKMDTAWVDGVPVYAAMEKPVKFRGQSNRTTSATSVVYGQSCGAMEFAISVYLDIPKTHLSFIEPHKWQRALGLGQRGQRTQQAWKRYLKDAAQERFPDLKVTLQTADALLLWEWQRQQLNTK